ncbi:hypothetical protein [Fictibacillus phosphorivorans]|nr:hypothetical protein [Fictibacillus phosphorivorans]
MLSLIALTQVECSPRLLPATRYSLPHKKGAAWNGNQHLQNQKKLTKTA